MKASFEKLQKHFNFREVFATYRVESDKMTRTEFEHTVSGMRGKLLNTARHFMKVSGAAEDAEDVVQEALTELWTLYDSGYPVRNVEALAMKITKTVCVRHYRKRKILTAPIDGKEFSGGVPASERVDLQETLNVRKMLLGQLSDTQRQYFMMRNERMMSLDEIAAATGHPKSSIKAAISQARKIMRESLMESDCKRTKYE